ncbi:hypothetical protein EWM64_g2787 [Hericium alpestre]|uniref:PIN domain-like protein n=1 Tax=Hericium alpestre TaxID=135208 RepID=A0A4Z0A3B4_9AGAM|nr:hypothetical protein EWM64_g2787 [Hericium alpestre]
MGVKSLWELLKPVGRPVLLETMEGKTMAIDSSIWIYQFQATMRDKEGRGLVNAHVLGFLRRICKLLFYGIKPVFVFDGGAPVLKRNTITERKKKKSGAAANHIKVAERLLAAQMRREAISHAHMQTYACCSQVGDPADLTFVDRSAKSSKGKGKAAAASGSVTIDENTVYLEDIDSNAPRTPAAKRSDPNRPGPSPTSSAKKNQWKDYDPYKLPDVNLEARVTKATTSSIPDHRLATEDELRDFIEAMRPEDFDVTSPAFRELPTEVQYDIIGDLRLKSRQTSYKRLQNMLKHSRTPLDFSKEQIKNLQQRNSLTQQLLITNDTIGQAHVAIPVRIASERNKAYVLVKNTGVEGGWVLGVRDEGTTKETPIQIDQDLPTAEQHAAEDEDSDMEMEEVAIPQPDDVDLDMREYRRGMALAGIAQRQAPKPRTKPSTPRTKRAKKKQKTRPLFELEEDELPPPPHHTVDDDLELVTAIQQSIDMAEDAEDADFQRALAASRMAIAGQSSTDASSSTSSVADIPEERTADSSEGEDLYVPGRLEIALAIANAGPTPKRPIMGRNPSNISPHSPAFGRSASGLLAHSRPIQPAVTPDVQSVTDSEDDMEPVPVTPLAKTVSMPTALETTSTKAQTVEPAPQPAAEMVASDSDEEMKEVLPSNELPSFSSASMQSLDVRRSIVREPELELPSLGPQYEQAIASSSVSARVTPIELTSPPKSASQTPVEVTRPLPQSPSGPPATIDSESESEALTDWSRSPSPVRDGAGPSETQAPRTAAGDDTWDAAQEMDPQGEEGEFARFMSQVKGKDLDSVRKEIDEEIKALNQQKKAAMRDSEDITQQMISQIMIMLRLFGIPYITAPMEAEAQCAALVRLGLVEGIITDDSDVFLFGGKRVFKNMFNQSKTVECFLLSDLSRELSLDQSKLIQLAYLLGSDYVEGLPGVGPVVAMELLKEFSGPNGLLDFREWWQKVQSGRDKPEDNRSKFRLRFKKRFKNLYLPPEWPNPAVQDAYYYPTVDESEEPFKWGLPDLDGLRNFFLQELGWGTSKVEDLLLPIIQKMNRRQQAQALNKQGNLNEYFDVQAGGSGTYAPRKRSAYTSKRLQEVVSAFRKEQKKQGGSSESSPQPTERTSSGSDEEVSSSSKAKGKGKAPVVKKAAGTARGRGRGRGKAKGTGRGRGRGSGTAAGSSRKRKRAASSGSEADDLADDTSESGSSYEPHDRAATPPPPRTRPRPRPRPVNKGKSTAVAEGQNGDSGIANEGGAGDD